MKTDSAVIKLHQIARKKADGTQPIMLLCRWKGARKEQFTGVSVPSSAWDARNARVKKSYANSATLNSKLNSLVNSVIARKLEYESSGIAYDVNMLLSSSSIDDSKPKSGSIVFATLVSNLIAEKALAYNTAKNYHLTVSKLTKYLNSSTFTILDLDESFCIRYCKYLSDSGISSSTINLIMAKVSSVWRYAIEKKLVSYDLFPFNSFKYWVKYKASEVKKAISKNNIDVMMKWLVCHHIVIDYVSGSFCYKDVELLEKRSSASFAVVAFLLGYYLQGLALIDLARLKASQFILKRSIIDGKEVEYYEVSGVKRAKTNKEVPIYIERTNNVMMLLEYYLSTASSREGYLLPIFRHSFDSKAQYSYDSDKAEKVCMVTVMNHVNGHLRALASEFDDIARKDYEAAGRDISKYTAFPTDVTYYACRHSFASHFIDGGGMPGELATMMGRSVVYISRYITQLKSADSILLARSKVYD